jgi:hypothetical protein
VRVALEGWWYALDARIFPYRNQPKEFLRRADCDPARRQKSIELRLSLVRILSFSYVPVCADGMGQYKVSVESRQAPESTIEEVSQPELLWVSKAET